MAAARAIRVLVNVSAQRGEITRAHSPNLAAIRKNRAHGKAQRLIDDDEMPGPEIHDKAWNPPLGSRLPSTM